MIAEERPLLVTGVVPPGPSGMRDYGELLAADLRARGRSVEVRWVDNDTLDLRWTVRSTRQFLALAVRTPRGTDVIWNYAPANIGFHGVPGPGALFGLVRRVRGGAPVAVLHELAQPFRRQPLIGRVRSFLQVAVLGFVLLGSRAVLVSTPQRQKRLERVLRVLRTPLRFAPVFSNFPPPRPVPPPDRPTGGTQPLSIVVLDYSADFARPQVVVDAVARLVGSGPVQLVLLGSPGAASPAGKRWIELAERAGVASSLSFTGVLSYDEFSARLLAADLIVLPNAQGPSCRKGTLAAAVSHGRPVVSLDGPMRWKAIVDAGAVAVAQPDAAALATAIARLRADPEAAATAGRNAAAFYDDQMAVGRTGDEISQLLRRR